MIPREIFARTIRRFLVDGAPNGLMIASTHGWTATVLVASRSTLWTLPSALKSESRRAANYRFRPIVLKKAG